MENLAFYEAGCERRTGPGRLAAIARRALRRVLRPMLLSLSDLLRDLGTRLDRLEGQQAPQRAEVEGLRDRLDEQAVAVCDELDGQGRRLDDLDERLRALSTYRRDSRAIIWRLGVLEDRIEALEGRDGPRPAAALRGPHRRPAAIDGPAPSTAPDPSVAWSDGGETA